MRSISKFLILLVSTLVGCSTIQPIARDACIVAQDVCHYANLACSLLPDTSAAGRALHAQALDSLLVVTAELDAMRPE